MAASSCLPIRPYNDSACSASLFPHVHFIVGLISHAIWRTVCPTISETACAAAGPERRRCVRRLHIFSRRRSDGATYRCDGPFGITFYFRGVLPARRAVRFPGWSYAHANDQI